MLLNKWEISVETENLSGKEAVKMKCRVRAILGIDRFSECLEANSLSCPHALSFGYSMLCHHPQWQQMVTEDPEA